MRNYHFLFSLFLLFSLWTVSISFAQEKITIEGVVISAEDNIPIPGVSVVEKGTQNGTNTNFDGEFVLNVASPEAILEISFVGLESKEMKVVEGQVMEIQLEKDRESLDEVLVIGYGTQKKKSATTAVDKVVAKDFHQGNANSPLDIIQGEIPGLSITRLDNNPNSSPAIQLRGVTSLTGDSSPLVVIDGIPGGNLDLVKKDDIESIDVLKSGAAAAIYGSRGNNGVILITTKKGVKGHTVFEYSAEFSRDFAISKPSFLSAAEYRDAIGQGLIPESQDRGYTTDIFDELLNKSNLSQYHSFAASGGSENNTYRASLFYQDFDGIAKENDREQFGFRVNFGQSAFNNKLQFRTNLASNFNRANLLGGGQFGVVQDWNPTAPIHAPYSVEQGTDLYNEGKFGFYQPQNGFNPFSEYENRLNRRNQQTFSGDLSLSYEVIEGLKLTFSGSYQRNTWNDREYRSKEDWEQYNPGSSYLGTGWASKSNHLSYDKTMEPTITYEKQIGEHSFDVLGGYSYQYSTSEDFGMKSSGFTTDGFKDWNFGSNNAITDTDLPRPEMTSHKEDNTLIGWFGRISYAFKDRYFIQGSIRHEGSSRFGKDQKWGDFPAFSAGWLISDEPFMESVEFVSDLKIRAGYGVTGNQGIPNYRSIITLGTGGKYPIFEDGASTPTYYQTYGPQNNPNPDLRWEEKKELNIGLDFGLWSNRVTGSFEVYSRNTENLLLDYTVPLPPFVQNSIFTNVGTIKNRGAEVSLKGYIIDNTDLKWHLSANGSYQKNELSTLSNQIYEASRISGGGIGNPGNLGDAIRNTEGGTIGDFYGRRFAGFTADGKWLFFDRNNNPVRDNQITEDDKAIIGNGQPRFYAALKSVFEYRNFDLSVFFRGKFDYDVLNTVDLFYGNQSLLPGNVLRSALDKFSDINEAPQYSDYYLEKGDFVKLDNITLGYTFNTSKNSPLQSFRVWVSARNLATITGYTGRDPEVADTGLFPGLDYREFYPRTTTITTGIKVEF